MLNEDRPGRPRSEAPATPGYNPQQAATIHALLAEEKQADYHREKLLGRRLPNGAKPLEKLNARHQRMIALHLTGEFSQVQIAEKLNCAAITVNRVLNDPLAQQIINNYHSSVEMDLKALLPLAVDAVREGLTHKDPEVRLKAVGRYGQMTRRNDPAQNSPVNVNVAFVNNVRERFIGELREAAEAYIEAEESDGGS